MKVSALFLLIAAYFLGTARADLTIVQKMEGAGLGGETTIKIKGDKARIETTPQMTTIMDAKTGEILNLMNTEKKFLRISAEKAKAMAAMTNQYTGNTASGAEKPKLAPTGKKETINGHQTEEYVFETPSFKGSFWVATKYPDGAVILKQLHAMTPSALTDVAGGVPNYRDLPGVPIRTRMSMGGKEITSTITSIKQDPLNEAEFSIPKDFQEVKVPNLEEVIGGKPSAAPAPKP